MAGIMLLGASSAFHLKVLADDRMFCRSSTGIVNVYGSDAASTTATRKPLKAITNLTTSISTVRFDPSAQMMAIASKSKKDQLRLVRANS